MIPVDRLEAKDSRAEQPTCKFSHFPPFHAFSQPVVQRDVCAFSPTRRTLQLALD